MADLTGSDSSPTDPAYSITQPLTFIIFGASGDLTHRKLIPALYNLFYQSLLPESLSVIGFARREKTDHTFRQEMRRALENSLSPASVNDDSWKKFSQRLFYHRGNFDDSNSYRFLRQRLEQIASEQHTPCNCLFYLATQPRYFAPIAQQLHEAELSRPGKNLSPFSRIIIEKPIGRNLSTARDLNTQLKSFFDESQIFRIDHYLGKETVQNLLVLRFANSIFEPIWNNNFIDHVQISVIETIGVETRGSFYELSGALRDIVQNHMMHLLSLVAMESPVSLDADAIRDEKVKLLKALQPLPSQCVGQNVVRAQYSAGTHAGRSVPGYLEEPGVDPHSTTDTFAALKLFIDNRRWAGVPFYLRTGKRLSVRITEIDIHFKSVPHLLFNTESLGPMQPNLLAIRIQPNEGISLQFQVKAPGPEMRIEPFKMDFGYQDAFGHAPPEAYERLLLDAALGDSTLFARRDEVEAAWAYLNPILSACEQQNISELPQYPAGSWGPKQADDLIAADGRTWALIKRPLHKHS